MKRFTNRQQAGRVLAGRLVHEAGPSTLVLALPRGGVPVGFEVARALRAPLDVWIVRKLGVPWRPELGLGAISESGHVHVSDAMCRQAGIGRTELAGIVERAEAEVADYSRRFRGSRDRPEIGGRRVILVDDGIATGGTVLAAVRSLRELDPESIVLAVPVAAADSLSRIRREVDDVECLATPEPFQAVGLWYHDFEQVSDEEVSRLVTESAAFRANGREAD